MKKAVNLLMAVSLFTLTILVTPALAQDPKDVGPDIYKVTFENEKLRVATITFKPGDKLGMHSHPNHLVYGLSAGKVLNVAADGTTKELEVKEGATHWAGPVTHTTENIGDTEVRALVIELKA